MNIHTSRPVSDIIRSKDEDGDGPGKFQSREEWKKAKELEEARKAGTAPAQVDEEGRDINPHIPQYISSAPWYFGAKGPTLKHQRGELIEKKKYASVHDAYERGLRGQTATKYRKGACENCGAMTHKRKDCLERPRKVGAKWSNDNIAPDEKLLPNLSLDFDGKRDRWSGFDPVMYKEMVVKEYEKVEEAKRALKEEKMKEELLNTDNAAEGLLKPVVGPEGPPGEGSQESDVEDSDDEDDKYADKVDMPGTKVDSKQRITVRNLRIREDTAKYLRNLDPDSAYYDPKTRSMRDDPYKSSKKSAPDLYAGENFVRYSGSTVEVLEAQKFAWQASEKGIDEHLNAEPTKAEILHKEFKVKASEIKETVKKSILDKYGGQEHLESPPDELKFSQTENYVEYSRSGRLVKGHERLPVKSIYEEDVYINIHTSIWGSYWKDFQWGYKCCHSFIKNSYCTGSAGKQAAQQPSLITTKTKEDVTENDVSEKDISTKPEKSSDISNEESSHEKKTKKRKSRSSSSSSSSSSNSSSSTSSSSSSSDSSDDEETPDGLKKKKLEEALKKERMKEHEELDERKRKYNSMYEIKQPTEEEIEAFRLNRQLDEDPMANYMSKKKKKY